MSDVSASGNNLFSELSIAKKTQDVPKNNELGQKAFLQLMITQMENQDPLSPQDNTEFIAQLAQFSSVESLDRLNTNFDNFTNNFTANQALQASTLVGRSVTVPTDTALIHSGSVVNGSIDVPANASNIGINIYSATGDLVSQLALGDHPEGEMVLRWDGKHIEINGETAKQSGAPDDYLPAGKYRFEVNADIEGKETQLKTALSANVNSVTVGTNGVLTLNLAGVGAVSLADVKQFNQ